MSYRKIPNLYKSKVILLFKECYALEKAHGTSTHISYCAKEDKLSFFSGGCKHESFIALFDQEKLLSMFREIILERPGVEKITVFGEGYGGKMQAMSATYGPNLCFVAFEVKINDTWLDVKQAEMLTIRLGLEFVPYKIIPTTEDAINTEMMADSEIAIRRGMGPKMREGIILRPLVEFVHQQGDGVIRAKHKRPEFAEREHTPRFADPDKLKVLEDAKAFADEWTTHFRLLSVLDQLKTEGAIIDPEMKDVNKIIKRMQEDIRRESEGEITESKELNKCIGTKTVQLFKNYLSMI